MFCTLLTHWWGSAAGSSIYSVTACRTCHAAQVTPDAVQLTPDMSCAGPPAVCHLACAACGGRWARGWQAAWTARCSATCCWASWASAPACCMPARSGSPATEGRAGRRQRRASGPCSSFSGLAQLYSSSGVFSQILICKKALWLAVLCQLHSWVASGSVPGNVAGTSRPSVCSLVRTPECRG